MKICCKDLLSLPSFKQIELVSGKNGLYRSVRWPYVTLTNSIAQWVRGGEFMFVSGIGYGKDEKALCRLLEESNQKNLSGVVFLIGADYIREIPSNVIALADQLELPLFKMPFHIPLVEPTEEISSLIVKNGIEDHALSEILSDILSGHCEKEAALISKASFYKFDLSGVHKIAVLMLETESLGIGAMLFYQKIVDNTFKIHGYNILSMIDYPTICCLLPCNSSEEEQTVEQIVLEARKKLLEKNEITRMAAAVGRPYPHIHEMAKSFREAEKALKVKWDGDSDATIGRFDELGIFKVLFEIHDFCEMEQYCAEMLGQLEQFDMQNHTCFLKTLEIYLEEDCNAVHAAGRLFVHRNSLNYRIKKIQTILHCDLSQHQDRLRLRDAFLLRTFLRIAK
ncbi:MAG: PucR family transcriptional regulator ligand-binding domain-containing protein [Ethanoligenens sp.]